MKRKTKFNKELLNEELKKFKLLTEYDFYYEKKELPEYNQLILGDISEADEEPKAEETPKPDEKGGGAEEVMSNLNLTGDEAGNETPEEPKMGEEPAAPDFGGEMPQEDSVEVDVTSLVKGSEEAKQSADKANDNIEALLTKFSELENKLSKMDKVNDKIENLEKEIVKRNPTPVEKLEMRSLDSFPYSQKLTDFWGQKRDNYEVGKEPVKKEFILKKEDIDDDYSEYQVKKSFDV